MIKSRYKLIIINKLRKIKRDKKERIKKIIIKYYLINCRQRDIEILLLS